MRRRIAPLDTLKTFVASPMELIALGDAIHFYMDAAQRGHIPKDKQHHIAPLLESFQARLVEQVEGSPHHE